MTDNILLLQFYCQFLLNFIDENNLTRHHFVKQKVKTTLKSFYEALESQMSRYVKGDENIKMGEMTSEVLHNLQQGVLSIEEYFCTLFFLAELPKEKQELFQADYQNLLNKYKN